MSPERWEKLKGELKDKFNLLEESSGSFEDVPGEYERLVFDGPMGKIRLDFVTKPVILDKKTIGSRRIGSETAVEYVYSEDEFSHQLKVYKWADNLDDWEEMKANMFGE